MDRFDYN